MAGESSFDVVSKVDRQEVDNALNQAAKEIAQRYDFKGTGATIEWTGENTIEISASADDRASAVLDARLDAVDSGELEQLPPHYRRLFQQDLKTAGRIAKTAVAPELERAAMQTVLGIISQWDAMVGRIVGQLEAHGLSDNTVIVVMSDHGQMLGDHWMHNMPPTHLDGVLRVPAIWRGPQYVRENAVTSALASHLDFAPTIHLSVFGAR